MTMRTAIAAGALASALAWSSGVQAQQAPECPKPGAAETVSGEVVKVDHSHGKVSVRGTNGTMHEFQASKETLQDMKVGDKIEAKLRVPEKCRKS
jgi:Cu/Ag efflux protein CusF